MRRMEVQMTNLQTLQTCPECFGNKTVIYRTIVPARVAGFRDEHMTCKLCKGTEKARRPPRLAQNAQKSAREIYSVNKSPINKRPEWHEW